MFGQGIALPEKDVKYKVQISIQNKTDHCISEKPKEINGSYNRWTAYATDPKSKE